MVTDLGNYSNKYIHMRFTTERLNRPSASGEQEWRSGESARLPPMWPGFDSQTGVISGLSLLLVLSLLRKVFLPGTLVLLSLQKLTFPNSNSIWNARPPLNKFLRVLGTTRANLLPFQRRL